MTKQFLSWINEVEKIFGGLDICGLDAVHDNKTGKYHILELNGTAIGLVGRHEIEDMGHMRDLVVAKLSSLEEVAVESKRPELAEEKTNPTPDALTQAARRIRELEEEVSALKLDAEQKQSE